jgi:hypothetical protein
VIGLMIKEGTAERNDAIFVLVKMIGLDLPCRYSRLSMLILL